MGLQDVRESFAGFFVLHGHEQLDSLAQVAIHEIGAGDEDGVFATLAEPEDAGVLQVAVDDADDADVFAQALHTRAEAADAADVEANLHARVGGFVERLDHLAVFEGVHLEHDLSGLALAGTLALAADEGDETFTQAEGCHRDLLEMHEAGAAGDGIEERGGIAAEFGAASEHADVGVELGGGFVVVSGAEVHVAHQAAGFASHDEADLGVGFESGDAVDDLGTRVDEIASTFEIAGLVKAGLQLDEHGDVLSGLGGADKGGDDAAVLRGAVKDLLDGDDIGIFRSLLDEREDGIKALIRMLHQDIATLDGVEDALTGLDGGAGLAFPWHHFQLLKASQARNGVVTAKIELAIHFVDLRAFGAAKLADDLHQVSWGTGLDFDADGSATLAFLQDGFHFAGEVKGTFVIEGDVGVSAHAEAGGGGDLFGGEEIADEEAHDVFDVHVKVLAAIWIGHHDVARQRGSLWQHEDGISLFRLAVFAVLHRADDHDVQRRDISAGLLGIQSHR